MTERLWQMTRISAGDYTLLSNDQTILWRFHTYYEDGDLIDADDRPIVGKFWRVLRFAHHPDTLAREDIACRWDEGTWHVVETLLPTRQACIDAAMQREPSGP